MSIFKVNSNTIDKSNDIKQLREQIRKLDEHLDFEMQVLYFSMRIVPDLVCKTEISDCLCLSRSWPERNRAGQRRWSLWRTIASSWRRRWITAMTKLCSNWRQHNNSEWLTLTARFPAQQLDGLIHAVVLSSGTTWCCRRPMRRGEQWPTTWRLYSPPQPTTCQLQR